METKFRHLPLAILLLALVLATGFEPCKASEAQTVQWYSNIHQALKRASLSKKWCLVVFNNPDALAGRQMKETVLTDASVKELLARNFVSVYLDASHPYSRKLLKHFNLSQTPSLLVFRPDGSLLSKAGAPATVDQFIVRVRSMVTANPPGRKAAPRTATTHRTVASLPGSQNEQTARNRDIRGILMGR